MGCRGNLKVTNTISYNNILHDVWNFDVLSNSPVPEAIDITYSIVNNDEYNGNIGCLTGSPEFTADFLLQDSSIGKNAGADNLDMGILP